MRRIIKDEVPEFWSDYIRRNRGSRYDQLEHSDSGKEVRTRIREHMSAHQKYICCYCCGRIGKDNSHNEHIRPKDRYPQLSMDYNNLLVSCTSNSCGMSKADKFDEKSFVSPIQEDCESHFRYEEDGHIVGTTEMGAYTVELLQLNTYALVDARKNLFRECRRW